MAIDFDGVIHNHKHPVEGRRMGGPMEGCKEMLDLWKSAGYKLIVFSVWGGNSKTIEDWMTYYQIPFDEVTNIKPQADYYIDDKAVRFTTWAELELP